MTSKATYPPGLTGGYMVSVTTVLIADVAGAGVSYLQVDSVILIPAIAALIAAIGARTAYRVYRWNRDRAKRDDAVKAESLVNAVEAVLASKTRRAQRGQQGAGLTSKEVTEFSQSIGEALLIAPNAPRVHVVAGAFYDAIGDLAKAARSYRKAVDLDPKDPDKHLALFVHLSRTNNEKADKHLYRALACARARPEAFTGIGMTLAVLARLDEAESAYRQGLKIDHRISALWFNFGNLLTRREKFLEAYEALKTAASINPNDPEIFCNYGNACIRVGKVDEAVTMLEKAVHLDPTYALAYRNLAGAYEGAKRVEEAEGAFRKFEELDAKQA